MLAMDKLDPRHSRVGVDWEDHRLCPPADQQAEIACSPVLELRESEEHTALHLTTLPMHQHVKDLYLLVHWESSKMMCCVFL